MIAPHGTLVGISDRCSVAPAIPMLAHGERAIRMLLQQLDPGFDRARQKPVVMVEKQYIFALAMKDTRIACSRDPAIRLVNITNPTRPGDSGCLIGRAISDHDDFDPGVGLQPYALDGFGQITR